MDISERNAVAQSVAIKCMRQVSGVLAKSPVDRWVRAIEVRKEVGDVAILDVVFWMFRSPTDRMTISVTLVKVENDGWTELVASMIPHDKKAVIWDFDKEGNPTVRQ